MVEKPSSEFHEDVAKQSISLYISSRHLVGQTSLPSRTLNLFHLQIYSGGGSKWELQSLLTLNASAGHSAPTGIAVNTLESTPTPNICFAAFQALHVGGVVYRLRAQVARRTPVRELRLRQVPLDHVRRRLSHDPARLDHRRRPQTHQEYSCSKIKRPDPKSKASGSFSSFFGHTINMIQK